MELFIGFTFYDIVLKLTSFFDNPNSEDHLPRPFGIFYVEDRYRYEEAMEEQIQSAIDKSGKGSLDALLKGRNTWTVN